MLRKFLPVVAAIMVAIPSYGQTTNPEFQLDANFLTSDGQRVGQARFSVETRVKPMYYGPVSTEDDFKFNIQLDSPSFANQGIDVVVKDFSLDSLTADSLGVLDQTYRSHLKPQNAPDRPLPAGFPNPIDVGDIVRLFDSTTHALLFSAPLGEEFDRGDANHDGHVDHSDLLVAEAHFGEDGIGPEAGDFTGDNHSDGADILQFQRTYYGVPVFGDATAAVPEPGMAVLGGIALVSAATLRRRRPAG